MKIILLLCFVAVHTVLGQDLNVSTIYGNIVGKVSASGLYKVWNTRYAQSPAGANRWKSPISLVKWNGTLDATQDLPICPQPSWYYLGSQSEDCLFLSVYVPIKHLSTDTPLPVQVFIHGGSFTSGGARLYTGEILAGNDIIFVSINYRLGTLGFLAHPALYTPENEGGVGLYGIQDQRAALQWVQDNIQYFGGDKNRVTVSGESAGAISICMHLALPNSNGLFHQGIMESGFCNGITPNDTNLEMGQTVVDYVKCNASADILSCLLAANATDLNAAAPSIFPSLSSELTQQPIDIIKSGKGFQVPLLIGTNLNESSLFLCPDYDNITSGQYAYVIAATFLGIAHDVLQEYPASSYQNPTAAYVDLASDYVFKCPTKALADVFSRNTSAPVFMYSFNNQPSFFLNPNVTYQLEGSNPRCLGAAHSFELPYLFDLYENLPAGGLLLNATELSLRTTMRNAWVSFVTHGVPTLPSLSWPLYNSASASFVNLNIGEISIESQFRVSHCAFWNPENSTSTSTTSFTTGSLTSTSGTGNSTTSTSSSTSTTTTNSTTATSSASRITLAWTGLLLVLFLALIN
eukprot:Phypoly_transcript_05202.p1 GENE.Phypoly_transcript_05202~~Phypoly_transcript_05202.p1  ORF type:complete len:577 (+),score=83.62 Phypoly_transcript_05202:86-1816(+)